MKLERIAPLREVLAEVGAPGFLPHERPLGDHHGHIQKVIEFPPLQEFLVGPDALGGDGRPGRTPVVLLQGRHGLQHVLFIAEDADLFRHHVPHLQADLARIFRSPRGQVAREPGQGLFTGAGGIGDPPRP